MSRKEDIVARKLELRDEIAAVENNEEAAEKLGAKKVYLEEEPKAAEPAGEISGVTLVEFKPTVTVVKPVEISIAAEDLEKKD